MQTDTMALTDSHTSYHDLLEYIIGSVGILIGIILGFLMHKYAVSIEEPYRYHTALTTIAACLVVASLVPQLIRNADQKMQMVDNVSPFIPAVRPFILLIGVYTMHDYVILANRHKTGLVAIVQFIFHFVDLVLYIAWTFQYAEYTTSVAESAIMYALGAFYTCAAILFFWSVCHVLANAMTSFFPPTRTTRRMQYTQESDQVSEESSDDEPIADIRPPRSRPPQSSPFRL